MNTIKLNLTVLLGAVVATLLSACGGSGESTPREVTTVVKLLQTPSDRSVTGDQALAREVSALRAAGADTVANAGCYLRFTRSPQGMFFILVDVAVDQLPIAVNREFLPLAELSPSEFTAWPCANL